MLDPLPLIGKVFLLLAPSIALGGLGAWLGRNVKGKATIIVLTIAALVTMGIFACVSWSGATGLALVFMFAFTFMTGLTLGPALNYYRKSLGWQTVAFAFVATAAIAAGAGAVGYVLGDYVTNSPLGFILLLALLGLLGLMAVVMLLRLGSVARIITGILGTLIFSVYILYDFARAATGPNTWDNAMRITVDLYLNLMNLLLQLLSVLSETQQRDSLLHGARELARLVGPLLRLA